MSMARKTLNSGHGLFRLEIDQRQWFVVMIVCKFSINPPLVSRISGRRDVTTCLWSIDTKRYWM